MVMHKHHGCHGGHDMAGSTTISRRKETKEMLRKMGSKGQTYDDVIRELIERVSIKELDARWNRILEEEESSHWMRHDVPGHAVGDSGPTAAQIACGTRTRIVKGLRVLEEDPFRPRPKADIRGIEGTNPRKYRTDLVIIGRSTPSLSATEGS